MIAMLRAAPTIPSHNPPETQGGGGGTTSKGQPHDVIAEDEAVEFKEVLLDTPIVGVEVVQHEPEG